MVIKYSKEALLDLVPALVTCGGDMGPLFAVARLLSDVKPENPMALLGDVPGPLAMIAEASLAKVEREAENGVATQGSVLNRYGLPKHFHEMNEDAQLGMDSVAREIPAGIRAVAHTLLPIKDGVYANGDVTIRFKGLTPLGPQEGNLVVHLGGVFLSHCPRGELDCLLAEQAKDEEFMAMARKAGTIDYEGTQLQRATQRAKESLGL